MAESETIQAAKDWCYINTPEYSPQFTKNIEQQWLFLLSIGHE